MNIMRKIKENKLETQSNLSKKIGGKINRKKI